jgi:hypothetical protein
MSQNKEDIRSDNGDPNLENGADAEPWDAGLRNSGRIRAQSADLSALRARDRATMRFAGSAEKVWCGGAVGHARGGRAVSQAPVPSGQRERS